MFDETAELENSKRTKELTDSCKYIKSMEQALVRSVWDEFGPEDDFELHKAEKHELLKWFNHAL